MPGNADEPAPSRDEVTRVLAQVAQRVPQADTRLLQLVYGELKRIARAKMAAQAPGHTLQPTALVHEAWLRLLGGGAQAQAQARANESANANEGAGADANAGSNAGAGADAPAPAPTPAPAWRDSGHFFTAAAAAMRSILVDHARRKKAEKRGGGGARVTLHPDLAPGEDEGPVLDRILAVHEVLDRLAADHPRPAKVVELLFFAGLSVVEAAQVLGVSDRTVKRDWRFGRAWLLGAIGEG